MIGQIIILIILVLLSGVFSSTEIAMFSLTNLKIRHLIERNVRHSKLLLKLKESSHKLLITILIGNNVVNIASAAMATAIALKVFGNAGVAIATGVMTLLILIFGEIIPKAFATKHAQSISLTMAPAINVMMKICYPLVIALNFLTTLILPKDDDIIPLVTEEEVRDIVKLSEEEGSIKEQEEQMIQNIFKLDDTCAEDIMTARLDVFAFEQDLKVKDIIEDTKKSGYSRIPVYKKQLDEVIGVLYAKDLLDANPEITLKQIVRPAFFVPETKRIDLLLREFKQKKIHIAMVVSEHGVVTGIVTIEDLIEEIIGEIYDETDKPENIINPIKKINKDTFSIKGKVHISDVEDKLSIEFGDEDNSTISGYITSKLNRIPEVGDSVIDGDYEFIVKKVDHKRVKELYAKRIKEDKK